MHVFDEKTEFPIFFQFLIFSVLPQVFTQELELMRHLERVHNKFDCDLCGKTFNTKKLLENHAMASHGGAKPQHCEKCDGWFLLRTLLLDHKCKKPGEFQCDRCEKSYSRQCDLTRHMDVHINLRFKCDKCGKGFATRPEMREHALAHKPQTQLHQCKECSKKFKLKSALDNHMLSHGADEKPHKCNQCKMKFKRKSSLYLHMRSHEKEDLLDCDLCDEVFDSKERLMAHKKEEHMDEDEKSEDEETTDEYDEELDVEFPHSVSPDKLKSSSNRKKKSKKSPTKRSRKKKVSFQDEDEDEFESGKSKKKKAAKKKGKKGASQVAVGRSSGIGGDYSSSYNLQSERPMWLSNSQPADYYTTTNQGTASSGGVVYAHAQTAGGTENFRWNNQEWSVENMNTAQYVTVPQSQSQVRNQPSVVQYNCPAYHTYQY